LIDEALFDRVQANLEKIRQQWVGRPPKRQYLLRGFVWCGAALSGGICGHRWVSQTAGHGGPAYTCGNFELYPYRRLCTEPRIQCAVLEAAAWAEVWRILTDPAGLLEMGEAYYAARAKPKNGQEVKLAREQAQLTTALRNTERRLDDGSLEYSDEVAAQLKTRRARLAVIGGELASVGRVVQLPSLRQAEAALAELRGPGGEPQKYPGRRAILEALEGLHMTCADRWLTIAGRVPLPEKNYLRGLDSQDNSFVSIPFYRKVRVA
jgi:hypothetical protein